MEYLNPTNQKSSLVQFVIHPLRSFFMFRLVKIYAWQWQKKEAALKAASPNTMKNFTI